MFQAPELQQKKHIFPTRRPPQKKQSRSPIKNKISSPEIEFPVHFFHQNPRVLWDIFLRYLFFRLLFKVTLVIVEYPMNSRPRKSFTVRCCRSWPCIWQRSQIHQVMMVVRQFWDQRDKQSLWRVLEDIEAQWDFMSVVIGSCSCAWCLGSLIVGVFHFEKNIWASLWVKTGWGLRLSAATDPKAPKSTSSPEVRWGFGISLLIWRGNKFRGGFYSFTVEEEMRKIGTCVLHT